ncbi:flotillin family protein [Cellulomonas soli]|uniref:Flotillin family protein n=1 Tax=Cellulomonas soli TaxID=931535 RepID=A0A512PGL9_9CELL|nr:flotillin family protein [Cellulomonas soli]NYI58218.1 putative membrane protein YqiK [Cellulomonas soli]GEP70349.1 flotillin family protein [Cellulomonas soli]
MQVGPFIWAGVVVVALLVCVGLFRAMWKVAEPNEALIISGLKTGDSGSALGFKVVTGRGTLVIPGVQTVRRLSLDINEAPLEVTCVTKQGIGVTVRGVVIFKVGDDDVSISNSARRFLDNQTTMVARIVNVFEGHLRSIIGSLTMEELVRERERLTQETRAAAGQELEKLGLVIDTLQIKDLIDPTGYIDNLAKPHAAEVEKNARIAQAQANQEATEAEAVAQAIQADAVRKSRISQAQYQAEVDRAASIAAQAGPLAAAEAHQQVVVQETEVSKLEAARRDQQLEAEVRRPADAERYKVEQEAQAARNAAIAEAEARKAAVIAAAEADAEKVRLNGASEQSRRTALAEAVRAEGEGQAAATKAVGEAEATAIRAKGFADAEAIERRAQALAANSDAVVMQQLAQNYPAIVSAAAEAFSGVDNMNVLNGAEGVTSMLMNVIGQGAAGLSTIKQILGQVQAAAPQASTASTVPTRPSHVESN